MSDILQEIIEHKKEEVAERKSLFPLKLLEKSVYYDSKTVSLKKYICREDKEGIIAEIKRSSPSKGMINPYFSVEKLSIGYMRAGASALSVLTDQKFFGGQSQDLSTARKFNFCPILRKDFIIDEYQVHEAKSIGADAILLIASVLEVSQHENLIKVAHELGLEVLMEVHNEHEWNKVKELDMDLVGVNNRNLRSFEVTLETSVKLAKVIPNDKVKVAESGIQSSEDIFFLRKYGYKGFLIGESFMKSSRPEQVCKSFIQDLKSQTV